MITASLPERFGMSRVAQFDMTLASDGTGGLLAGRKGQAATDLGCRVAASTAIGIMKLTIEAWLADQGAEPEAFGKAAFDALRRMAC